ncbi:hypothetical protein ABFX02_07G067100 [Erythranthe guttata]
MAENGSNREEPVKQLLVNLIIKCNKDGKEIYVKVKRNVRIKKLLRGFCQHASIEYRSTRFVIDNRTFYHDKTPNQLGLEDDDQIDALVDASGA